MKEIELFPQDLNKSIVDVSSTKLEEHYMTTRELAKVLNVEIRTIQLAVKRILDPAKVHSKVINGGKSMIFNEKQATLIKQEIQKHHNLKTRQIDSVSTKLEVLANYKAATDAYVQLIEAEKAELQAKNEEQKQQLIEQKPKVEVYDAICDSSTLQDLQTVSVTLGLKNIFKVLQADKIIECKYTDDGQKYYKPLSQYTSYLVLKDGKPWQDKDGSIKIRPRLFVTGKGLTWLSKRYK